MLALFLLNLLFLLPARAREQALFTSSVTYCNPPETLLIQQFDVAYFPNNHSVAFNISAASVQANTSVTAHLLLNVYGLQPVNFTIDLCHILNGALCPLPMYNFVGADIIQLPSSANIQNKVPDIAFKIPDLEGFVQLVLTEVGTGTVKACVQSTLSNGWSTHQPAVTWFTGAVVLLCFFVTIFSSADSFKATSFLFLELFRLSQFIVASCLFSLNYPSAFRAFCLNFSWAWFLFPMSPQSPLQNAINHMRMKTGGDVLDSSGSAIEYVNRKLSPYNAFVANSAPVLLTKVREVQTVTNSSSNVLQAGLPIYVNSLGITTPNAFTTVFLCLLMASGIILSLLGLSLLATRYSDRLRSLIPSSVLRSRWRTRSFFIIPLVFLPVVTLACDQWTLHDSWLASLFAALCFASLCGVAAYRAFLTQRGQGPTDFRSTADTAILGDYKPGHSWFISLPIVFSWFTALLVAFGQGHDVVQLPLFMGLEVLSLAALLVYRPHIRRGDNIMSICLSLGRLVCIGLMMAFIQRIAVSAIPRTIIGLGISVVFSCGFLWLLFRFSVHIVHHHRNAGRFHFLKEHETREPSA
ncbi:hypothetical protein BDN72DRAFT_508086 [Pluteus cervinus]|uniref:Uncharacterized protein n=1 Tax=Pluteus cervinus TaxID=181527 RepID=A0ACD3BBF3_9AGAR|nr:hypothetical protein BDN72DRAFT_508086 [Pluteus cervinus]